MTRFANYPTPIEELRNINISFLSKHGYIKPNRGNLGTLTWTSPHGTKNSIGFRTVVWETSGIITLDYTFDRTEKKRYDVRLITRPSNLGNGLLWFFLCPFTGRVCRKLHLINGDFKHRSSLPGLLYEKQLESKRCRSWHRMYAGEFCGDLYSELFSKYFKKYYQGKITKRFARISKKLQAIENCSEDEFLKLLD